MTSTKQKTSKASNPGGLRVISNRQLKQLARRVFWKGVNAAHPDTTIRIEEVTHFEGVFKAWWKANVGDG